MSTRLLEAFEADPLFRFCAPCSRLTSHFRLSFWGKLGQVMRDSVDILKYAPLPSGSLVLCMGGSKGISPLFDSSPSNFETPLLSTRFLRKDRSIPPRQDHSSLPNDARAFSWHNGNLPHSMEKSLLPQSMISTRPCSAHGSSSNDYNRIYKRSFFPVFRKPIRVKA